MEIIFNPPLKLYIVTNHEGKYFKSVGYSGYGTGGAGNWVDDINKSKVYTKIGQARSRVTFYAKNPNFPIPEILEITAGVAFKLDETKRVQKAVDKIKKGKRRIRATSC